MIYYSQDNSKRFSPGSDFKDQIFTGKLSGVDSGGELRQGGFSLIERKIQYYLFKTGKNFVDVKTLVWSAYVWRTTTATFFSFNNI